LKGILLLGALLFILFFFVWFFRTATNVTSDIFLKNIFESFYKNALLSLIMILLFLVFVVAVLFYYK